MKLHGIVRKNVEMNMKKMRERNKMVIGILRDFIVEKDLEEELLKFTSKHYSEEERIKIEEVLNSEDLS